MRKFKIEVEDGLYDTFEETEDGTVRIGLGYEEKDLLWVRRIDINVNKLQAFKYPTLHKYLDLVTERLEPQILQMAA